MTMSLLLVVEVVLQPRESRPHDNREGDPPVDHFFFPCFKAQLFPSLVNIGLFANVA